MPPRPHDSPDSMDYPTLAWHEWDTAIRRSLAKRLRLALRDVKRHLRTVGRHRPVDLRAVRRRPTALDRDEIVLICVLRNAAKQLPSFLSHYRQLGIRRFAIVDDQSDDDTRALLLLQDDVDLYESAVRFSGSGGGLVWRDMLVDLYGRNRWYVSVDSDEYLTYPDCENRSVRHFIGDLKSRSLSRSHAVMLDIYPDGPIGLLNPHLPSTALPTAVCPLYDSTGYTVTLDSRGVQVRGGPRQRRFGTAARVSKYPVIYMNRWARFASTDHHAPLPLSHNGGAVHAVLLHHKFTGDTVERFRLAAEQGQHWKGAANYQREVTHADFDHTLDLRYGGSMRYENSMKLVDAGFMRDLRTVGRP